jgi:uncharacterized protein YggU (UPF0235/DUF167 family)
VDSVGYTEDDLKAAKMEFVELSAWVIPNATRDEIVGWDDGSLKVKTSAPPEPEKANKAVCLILSKHLGPTKRSIAVAQGKASQRKRPLQVAS